MLSEIKDERLRKSDNKSDNTAAHPALSVVKRVACCIAKESSTQIGLIFLALSLVLCSPSFLAQAQSPALAQSPAQTPSKAGSIGTPAKSAKKIPASERLKTAETKLEFIGNSLKRKDISDKQLQSLRAQLTPLQNEIKSLIDQIEPDHKAAKSRLAELGPGPKKNAAPEAAAIAAQRKKLTDAFNTVDAQLKRANVARLRNIQLADTIVNRRRDLLQQKLTERSASILNPIFWIEAAKETPDTVNATIRLLSDWGRFAVAKLNTGFWWHLFGFIILLGIGWWLLFHLAERVLPTFSSSGSPTEFQKFRNTVWVTLVFYAVPTIAVTLAIAGLWYIGLINARIDPLFVSINLTVQKVALAVGLAFGVLSPSNPQWRAISVSNTRARRLTKLAVTTAIIISILDIFETLMTMTAAPLVLSQPVRAIATLAIALTIATRLYGNAIEEPKYDAAYGPIVEPQQTLAAWRLGIWLTVIAITVANLFGFYNLAVFIVHQAIWFVLIVVSAFALKSLADTGLSILLQADALAGKAVASTLGIQQRSLDQIAIILTGLAKLVIYLTAVLLIAAPIGIVSKESIYSSATSAFFGFKVGGLHISLSTIIFAIALFAAGYVASRLFQRWLNSRYLPATSLDSGLQNSISTSVGYLGFVIAIGIAASYAGLSFQNLALVAGALSLGIGFGLQSIVNNFVSGLILLWERSVKVGDWVIVGSDEGIVRRITVRSTEIETFDRQVVIVPNSSLISGVVKNWVRNDLTGRVAIPIGVSYDSDPDHVREVLLSCADTHDLVMKEPKPYVIFTNFGDSSLDFELRCYISNIGNALTVRSHLRFEIFRRLKEADIEIPFPQRDIHIRDFDKIEKLATGVQKPESE